MSKTNEKIFLIIYFILIASLSAGFDLSYLVSTILFFVPPSVYVTLRRPKLFKSIGIYAILIAIPFVILVDTLGLYNNAWWETSVFPVRIFGLVPFDTVIWGTLYAYAVPVLYEYFFGTRESVVLTRKFWKFEASLLTALLVFIVVFSLNREWFTIPYFYAIFAGLFYVFVSIVGFVKRKREFLQLLRQCSFFSILLFIGELGSLAARQWGFSGSEYLGMIRIRHISFPFEEMIWILIGVPAFLYVYLRLTDPSGSAQA